MTLYILIVLSGKEVNVELIYLIISVYLTFVTTILQCRLK